MRSFIAFIASFMLFTSCATIAPGRGALIVSASTQDHILQDARVVCAFEHACEDATTKSHVRGHDECIANEVRFIRAGGRSFIEDCQDMRPCSTFICIAMHRSVRSIATSVGGKIDDASSPPAL